MSRAVRLGYACRGVGYDGSRLRRFGATLIIAHMPAWRHRHDRPSDVRVLVRRGHNVVCFVRPRAGGGGSFQPDSQRGRIRRAPVRFVDVSKPASLVSDGFRSERFDAVVSCMASRTGAPKDAWAIDHQAHVNLLAAAQQAGVAHFVQLSAICVQKPISRFSMRNWRSRRRLLSRGSNIRS